MNSKSVISMLHSYANVPSSWGRSHDSGEIESAISYLEELLIELDYVGPSMSDNQIQNIAKKAAMVEGEFDE